MQDWLSHRVRATPNRTALVRAATGETLAFASLDAMVDDLAGRLAALGIERGDHLGMVMEARLAAVCTVYAAERLGVVLVPLGDDLTAVELADQLEVADVTTLVCSSETEATAVEAFGGPVCSVDESTVDGVRSLAAVSPADVTPAEWDLRDTRLLLFTSGTTGAPKAVRLTQGNLLWSAMSSVFRLGLHDDDRWLVCLSLHHMGGLSPVVRMPLYGMTVVLEESFDPGRTADHIGSYDVTCVSLVPTMLKRMLDLRGTLADSLRVVLLGGAPAPDDLLRRCRDFSVPVYPTYGMTETASQVATATPREAFDDVGTVGRPLFWASVTVRDDGAEVPRGEPGELVVGGPTVSPGYYDNSAATAAAFGPHGLRTGDVGYLDDEGRLFVLGRVDDQIITGGENVHPQEVADVLRAHPMVDDVAVVGVPDDEWGELVGALVVPGDDALTVDDLERHCRERLAGFKLPRAVSFVESLPRTASGTVEREAARDRLVEGMAASGDGHELDVDAEVIAETDIDEGGSGDRSPPTDDPGGDVSRAAGTGTHTDPDRETDARDTPEDRVDTGAPTDNGGEGSDPTTTDDEAEPETFLIGGSDWRPGDRVDAADEDGEDGDDTTTDDADQSSEPSEPSETPGAPEPPETPDFVREALTEEEPDDEVGPDTEGGGGDDEHAAESDGDDDAGNESGNDEGEHENDEGEHENDEGEHENDEGEHENDEGESGDDAGDDGRPA